MPHAVRELGSDKGQRIEIRWLGGRSIAGVIYAFVFAAVLLTLALSEGQFRSVHRAMMAIAAAGLGYYIAANLLNRTTLAVEGENLKVEHGPLPMRKRVELPVAEVSRLRSERDNARITLRTRQGEELTLLDELRAETVAALEPMFQRMLESKP